MIPCSTRQSQLASIQDVFDIFSFEVSRRLSFFSFFFFFPRLGARTLWFASSTSFGDGYRNASRSQKKKKKKKKKRLGEWGFFFFFSNPAPHFSPTRFFRSERTGDEKALVSGGRWRLCDNVPQVRTLVPEKNVSVLLTKVTVRPGLDWYNF